MANTDLNHSETKTEANGVHLQEFQQMEKKINLYPHEVVRGEVPHQEDPTGNRGPETEAKEKIIRL